MNHWPLPAVGLPGAGYCPRTRHCAIVGAPTITRLQRFLGRAANCQCTFARRRKLVILVTGSVLAKCRSGRDSRRPLEVTVRRALGALTGPGKPGCKPYGDSRSQI